MPLRSSLTLALCFLLVLSPAVSIAQDDDPDRLKGLSLADLIGVKMIYASLGDYQACVDCSLPSVSYTVLPMFKGETPAGFVSQDWDKTIISSVEVPLGSEFISSNCSQHDVPVSNWVVAGGSKDDDGNLRISSAWEITPSGGFTLRSSVPADLLCRSSHPPI